MLVHPVVVPGSGTRSWTVLGDDDVPVVPVDRFLAYLTDIGRSPNTVRAYAFDLKNYWEFISFRGLDWREARLEDVGEFVAGPVATDLKRAQISWPAARASRVRWLAGSVVRCLGRLPGVRRVLAAS